MSIGSKIKSMFTESVPVGQTISLRKARVMNLSSISELEPEVHLKKWVKAVLSTAPWAALAIILFAVFLQGAVATGALVYGLVKAAIAILVTVIADETMFNGMPAVQENSWLPMIRRSMVFLGICWLMAVT